MQFVITQCERNADHFPLYTLIVDGDVPPGGKDQLFPAVWTRAAAAMRPGDILTEVHKGCNPVSLTYKQVQESIAADEAFVRGE